MKTKKKAFTLMTGAAYLLGSAGVVEAQTVEVQTPQLEPREEESFTGVANVKGQFAFDQDTLTPPDEVFSLFGTAATAACAKPGFALDKAERQEYYVNVGRRLKKNFTISLDKLESMKARNTGMVCSCATSGAVAMANVTGVPVRDILSMAELEDDANAIVFRDAQGYGIPMPLDYVLEKEALLVYKVGDVENAEGLQVWMPDTVARYFTRQVMEIEVLHTDKALKVMDVEPQHRAKVSIMNRFTKSFAPGDEITFEGYADDCGRAISGIEFSMDNGHTWTSCETPGTDAQKWVYWHFSYVPEAAGTYKLDVRARTADGSVSPLASSIVFTVDAGPVNS